MIGSAGVPAAVAEASRLRIAQSNWQFSVQRLRNSMSARLNSSGHSS